MYTRDFTITIRAGGESRARKFAARRPAQRRRRIFNELADAKPNSELSVISFRARFNARPTTRDTATGISMNGKRRITRLVISAVKPHGNHGVSVSRCKRSEREPERI